MRPLLSATSIAVNPRWPGLPHRLIAVLAGHGSDACVLELELCAGSSAVRYRMLDPCVLAHPGPVVDAVPVTLDTAGLEHASLSVECVPGGSGSLSLWTHGCRAELFDDSGPTFDGGVTLWALSSTRVLFSYYPVGGCEVPGGSGSGGGSGGGGGMSPSSPSAALSSSPSSSSSSSLTRVMSLAGDEFEEIHVPGVDTSAPTVWAGLGIQITSRGVSVLGVDGTLAVRWVAADEAGGVSNSVAIGLGCADDQGRIVVASGNRVRLLNVTDASGRLTSAAAQAAQAIAVVGSGELANQISAVAVCGGGGLSGTGSGGGGSHTGGGTVCVGEWRSNAVRLLRHRASGGVGDDHARLEVIASVVCGHAHPRSIAIVGASVLVGSADGAVATLRLDEPQPGVVGATATLTLGKRYYVGDGETTLHAMPGGNQVLCVSSRCAVIDLSQQQAKAHRVVGLRGVRSLCLVDTPLLGRAFACISAKEELLFGAVSTEPAMQREWTPFRERLRAILRCFWIFLFCFVLDFLVLSCFVLFCFCFVFFV
jgi:hypothetical protein